MRHQGSRVVAWGCFLLLAGASVLTAQGTPRWQIQEITQPQELKGANNGKGSQAAQPPNQLRVPPSAPQDVLGQGYVSEVEPNNTSATATPLGGSDVVVRANVFPNADVDWYSFTAAVGDRVYAATMTSFSANASSDSQLRIFQPDGTTLIEFDDDDGSLGGLSSSVAGAAITAPGTHFIEIRHFSATNQLRPYDLHFRLQSGAPTPEVEANNTPATATPLAAGGWMSGSVNPAADADFYSLTLAAGDTVYASLDMNPERDGTTWNGRLGVALFGTALNQILVVNDGSVASPNSEAHFFTVKDAGTYFIYVDEPAAGGNVAFTYNLSVSVHPNTNETANCTTYTSTNVPQTIPTGPGSVPSTITVPGNPRIADLNVAIDLTHANMPDLDIHLVSPQGNDNGLLSDIGAAAQTAMNLVLDDEAGIPAGLFTVLSPAVFKPELAYRLSWFDGEDAGGVWTLNIRDDTAANGGTLNNWSLTICEPPPPPACPPGTVVTTVFSSDFEAGDAGFTHAGAQDEWERGLPTFAPITTCNSGTNCWKTDLDNTYNASANQILLSPAINLAGLQAPVVVTWAQRYQMENASFDQYSVDFQQVGGATPVRLFEWLDATMTDTVGNPGVLINESSGWSTFSRRADSLAGLSSELEFTVATDTTVQFAGVAIDDVAVTACRLVVSDLAITKTDGTATAVPGLSTVYTIVASNAGPDPVTGGTVADTFPAACTSVSWTCVGAGGGTCTAAGAGNINDVVNLPVGGSVTYTATCNISAAATGSLINTATVSSSNSDPVPANNSATDTDTLTPQANLGITKTDGLTTAGPGQAITYTIVASNAGPSNAPGSTVADTFPAALTGVTWTCVGAGGGTCTAAGAGNITDVVNLPAGGSVTYTVNATIDGAFLGLLSNTVTVVTAGGVTDPTPANNSATDTTNVVSAASLSGTKDVVGQFTEGGAITYTIVITNAGPGTQLDNPGDEFVDVLPAELTFVGVNADVGTASNVGNTVSWNGSLAATASVTITIDATINAGTAGQLISNQGTINFDGDGNGTNEASATTDDPTAGGAADPTDLIVGSQNPVEIPTLSTVSLALLILLLAFAAGVVLRRRRA